MIHWHGIAQQGGGWPFLSDRGDSCFSPQPPSRRADEEESSSASTLGVRPPDTSLSLPTTPDKQTAWPRAFPLPTVEEKQWHQSCSVQTNVVPINVSGKAAPTRGGRGEVTELSWDLGRMLPTGCWVVGGRAECPCPRRPRGDSSGMLVCVIPCHLSCHLQLRVSDPRHQPVSCLCHAALPAGSVVTLALTALRLSIHPSIHPSVLAALQLPDTPWTRTATDRVPQCHIPTVLKCL